MGWVWGFNKPGHPGYYDVVQKVDRLPRELHCDDRYVARGYAVCLEPGPVWAFYDNLESAYVLGRVAMMTPDLGVLVVRAALRVVFDDQLNRDRRELAVCGNNLLEDRTGEREINDWVARARSVNDYYAPDPPLVRRVAAPFPFAMGKPSTL